MHHPIHILLRGAGFVNRGAEAMLRTCQVELARRIPGAVFHVILAREEAEPAMGAGLVWHAPGQFRGQRFGPRFGRWATVVAASRTTPHLARIDRFCRTTALDVVAIGQVDAVVDISGYAYGDSWSAPFGYRQTAAWSEYARLTGIPYILLPQAWGPFQDPMVSSYTRQICTAASRVFARDEESLGYLKHLLQGTPVDLLLAPDIAFRFNGAHSRVGAAVLSREGIDMQHGPLIGLAPNMRVYERAEGMGAANRYVQVLIAVARHCISRLGACVVLIPHEISTPGSPHRDDRFLCGLVKTALAGQPDCIALMDHHRTEVLKAVLGHLDLLIGSRFHSLVLALSSGVPVVAAGWSHKYRELLKPFGLADLVLEHDELDTPEALIDKIEQGWQRREETCQQIAQVLPGIRAKVDALFDDVAELIQEQASARQA